MMITFLQESKYTKNSFLHLDSPKGATHFRDSGGDIQLITNLPQQNQQEEPLDMPSTEDKQKPSNQTPSTGQTEPLDMPSMDFSEKKDSEQKPTSEPLDLPSAL